MYINNSLILYIVDKIIRYQITEWLQNITAKHIYNALHLYWIDIYLGPFDYIYHNAGKNFVSKKFCQLATLLGNTTKSVFVEAYESIKLVEQYYAILRQAYKVIIEDL